MANVSSAFRVCLSLFHIVFKVMRFREQLILAYKLFGGATGKMRTCGRADLRIFWT